jgi:2-dehydro-3-deoxyphosphogalactonate aldolase
LLAVLPGTSRIWAVGGVGPTAFEDWWTSGVRAFGVGSDIYRAGQSAEATFERARAAVSAAASLSRVMPA